jgi:integral membrane sensor domain MASE1
MRTTFTFSNRVRPQVQIFLAALLTLASLTVAPAVRADDYPSRVIKLIVPYPPGGATDVIGRVMAQTALVPPAISVRQRWPRRHRMVTRC